MDICKQYFKVIVKCAKLVNSIMNFKQEDYKEFKGLKWIAGFKKPYTLSKFTAYRRGLGFNPINKFSKNSIAHHINNNQIVYISKELHKNSNFLNSHNHRKQVKNNIRKINKFLYLKILVYNFINVFKNDVRKNKKNEFEYRNC